MRGKIEKIIHAPKRYLERVGFTIRQNKAKYVKRLWLDGLSAIIYSAISVYMICIQEADIIVLLLNIFCLFRATINNTISASQVTIRNDEVDITIKGKIYIYYHLKAAGYIIGFFFMVISWVFLYASGPHPLIKFYSIIAIGAVLFNDLENNFVCAYDAIINPIV